MQWNLVLTQRFSVISENITITTHMLPKTKVFVHVLFVADSMGLTSITVT